MTAPTGEFAFIDWLRRRTPADPRVLLGPGDDTAAVHFTAGAPVLVTTDMLLEGSCFVLAEAGPRRVGRKAMAVNLSDIAAMAGRPVAAVVSVGLPRAGGRTVGEEFGEEPEFVTPDGRRVTRRFRIAAQDRFAQVNDVELFYDVTHPDGRQERLVHAFGMRWVFRFEAEHLLARAGFEVEHLYAGYDRSEYGSSYPGELVFIARKASSGRV